jgi:hypothetical protein
VPGETERKNIQWEKPKLYCRSGAVSGEIKQRPAAKAKSASHVQEDRDALLIPLHA